MGMETKTPSIMSTLNPNASEFVPAAVQRPTVVAQTNTMTPAAVVTTYPEYSSEWWSRFETDRAFRDQHVSQFLFQSAEQRNEVLASLEEISDLDQFRGYQEHLVDLEEEEILARNFQELGCFLDEDLRLTDTNSAELPEELRQQQQQQEEQQPPWSKYQFQYENKTKPHKVGSYPKKWNTYRLHQPRSDM